MTALEFFANFNECDENNASLCGVMNVHQGWEARGSFRYNELKFGTQSKRGKNEVQRDAKERERKCQNRTGGLKEDAMCHPIFIFPSYLKTDPIFNLVIRQRTTLPNFPRSWV